MARKDDLLEEAAALGIEGLNGDFRNDVIQARIDDAREAQALQADEDGAEEPAEEQAEEVAEDAPAPVAASSEPVFTLAQLRAYSQTLFGCGEHVLVGARSAGCIPVDPVTKDQVRAGIDQYLNMPVEPGKEG